MVFDKYFRYQMVAFGYRGGKAAKPKALLEAALKRDASRDHTLRMSTVRGARALDSVAGGMILGRKSGAAKIPSGSADYAALIRPRSAHLR